MATPNTYFSGDLAGLSAAEDAGNRTALAERQAVMNYNTALRALQTQDQGQRSNERIAATQAQGQRDVAGINADASKYGAASRLQGDMANNARMLQIAQMQHDNEVRALAAHEKETGMIDARERRRLELQEQQLRDATQNFTAELQSREKIANIQVGAGNPRVTDEILRQLPGAQQADAQSAAEAEAQNAYMKDGARHWFWPNTTAQERYQKLTPDQKARVTVVGDNFVPRVQSYANQLMRFLPGLNRTNGISVATPPIVPRTGQAAIDYGTINLPPDAAPEIDPRVLPITGSAQQSPAIIPFVYQPPGPATKAGTYADFLRARAARGE